MVNVGEGKEPIGAAIVVVGADLEVSSLYVFDTDLVPVKRHRELARTLPEEVIQDNVKMAVFQQFQPPCSDTRSLVVYGYQVVVDPIHQ